MTNVQQLGYCTVHVVLYHVVGMQLHAVVYVCRTHTNNRFFVQQQKLLNSI